MLEKIFGLKKHGTNVRTELIAGLTTFFAMAYIIFVNPSYLSATGMEYTAVLVATCVSAAIGCFLTAFLANVPFAQAPGMGLNAFFTYTVCFGMGYTWQQGLTIVLLSGILFLIITVSPIRSKIISSIPAPLKSAISAGIGLFIAFIGLLNADVVKLIGDTVVDGVVVATDYSDMGAITTAGPLLALIGVVITGILMAWKVKGAMVIGIIATTIIGIPMGITKMPEEITMSHVSLLPTLFKFDFPGLVKVGLLPLATSVVTFAMCDCFDTVGTLIGTAGNAGMLDKDGNLPHGDRADRRRHGHLRGRLPGHLHRHHVRRVLHRYFRRRPHRSDQRRRRHPVPAEHLPCAHRRNHSDAGDRARADHRGYAHDRQRRQDRLVRR